MCARAREAGLRTAGSRGIRGENVFFALFDPCRRIFWTKTTVSLGGSWIGMPVCRGIRGGQHPAASLIVGPAGGRLCFMKQLSICPFIRQSGVVYLEPLEDLLATQTETIVKASSYAERCQMPPAARNRFRCLIDIPADMRIHSMNETFG